MSVHKYVCFPNNGYYYLYYSLYYLPIFHFLLFNCRSWSFKCKPYTYAVWTHCPLVPTISHSSTCFISLCPVVLFLNQNSHSVFLHTKNKTINKPVSFPVFHYPLSSFHFTIYIFFKWVICTHWLILFTALTVADCHALPHNSDIRHHWWPAAWQSQWTHFIWNCWPLFTSDNPFLPWHSVICFTWFV